MNLESSAEKMYNSFEDFLIAVNKHTDSQSYAVIKCSSKKSEKNELICKRTLRCDWKNKYVETVSNAHRKCWTTDTQLQKCLFRVNVLRKEKKWILTVSWSEHNHSFTIKFFYSVLRKLNSDVQKTIAKQSAAEIIFEQVVTALWNMNSTMSLIKWDVYNVKALIK